MLKVGMLGLAAALVASTPAPATTFTIQEFICPVGGEKFKTTVVGSSTSAGQRPDGQPYGTVPIVPLVECTNGFVYFEEEFSKADVEKLTPLVLSAEYQAMKMEAPHYRAWWLMRQLGRDPFDAARMLLIASWGSDNDPVRKARYKRSFVTSVAGLSWSADKRDRWFWLNARAANALRELGDFKASTALLTKIDQLRRLPIDMEQCEAARFLIDGLLKLNAERNPTAESTNLIPTSAAAQRCLNAPDALTASELKACERDDVRQAKAELEEYRRSDD